MKSIIVKIKTIIVTISVILNSIVKIIAANIELRKTIGTEIPIVEGQQVFINNKIAGGLVMTLPLPPRLQACAWTVKGMPPSIALSHECISWEHGTFILWHEIAHNAMEHYTGSIKRCERNEMEADLFSASIVGKKVAMNALYGIGVEITDLIYSEENKIKKEMYSSASMEVVRRYEFLSSIPNGALNVFSEDMDLNKRIKMIRLIMSMH